MVSTECIIAFAHHKVKKSFKLDCLYPSDFSEEVWRHSEISNYSFLNSSFSNIINQNLGFPGGSVVKKKKTHLPMTEIGGRSLGQENPQEKEMATHSSIQTWRTPWKEEPGGPQSLGVTESDTTEHVPTIRIYIRG